MLAPANSIRIVLEATIEGAPDEVAALQEALRRAVADHGGTLQAIESTNAKRKDN